MVKVFGWDISTSNVGLAVIEDGRLVLSDVLTPRARELPEKMDEFVAWVEPILANNLDVSTHFVEERLANFSFGRTSMGTLMTLGAFNRMTAWHLSRRHCALGCPCQLRMVHPSTIRSFVKRQPLGMSLEVDKKEANLALVSSLFPGFVVRRTRSGKAARGVYDRADAALVALAGMEKFT